MIRTRSLLVISFALLILAGCGVNPSPAPTTPATVANVYVASSSVLPQIYAFPGNSTGAPTPANTVTVPALNLVTALAVDSSGNLYAATDLDIREYAAGATGTATPIRTIPFDSTTTLTDTFSIAVDSAGNLYAAQNNFTAGPANASILVFSSTANGSVAPIRTITGALTGLTLPEQLALDSSGNLYVLTPTSTRSRPFSSSLPAPMAMPHLSGR